MLEYFKISVQFITIAKKCLFKKLSEAKESYGQKMKDIQRYLRALFGVWLS